MLLDIVDENPGERLLAFLERARASGVDWNALHVRGSGLPQPLRQANIPATAEAALGGYPYALYFFQDGDIVILWNGPQGVALDATLQGLTGHFGAQVRSFAICYNLRADSGGIRKLCERKIAAQSSNQIIAFRAAAQDRKRRQQPQILIVEDQAFSSRLLLTMLERNYKTSLATDAEAALAIYLKMAPDIVLLDIELPGINGDEFVGMLTKLDPDAYVVMVSASAWLENVTRSKKNGAKGFIAKPYSKQKILDSVHMFVRTRMPMVGALHG
jgi:two-component system chemotaxis response regulator CheY